MWNIFSNLVWKEQPECCVWWKRNGRSFETPVRWRVGFVRVLKIGRCSGSIITANDGRPHENANTERDDGLVHFLTEWSSWKTRLFYSPNCSPVPVVRCVHFLWPILIGIELLMAVFLQFSPEGKCFISADTVSSVTHWSLFAALIFHFETGPSVEGTDQLPKQMACLLLSVGDRAREIADRFSRLFFHQVSR